MMLSEFIRDVRKQLSLSQQQLAEALNVNFSTINRWENDKVIPSNLAQKTFFNFCQDNFIEIPEELRNNTSK
ncbi:helix-turn-helix domain-containing protein [Ferroacidibacillus organovorans]|uniref:XRE family transcriptional regulator n=1 Tax=Ferroacidibacillus organovorans TaxID=1765683 RepID=A0A853K9L9_9BACL|nr:helix-turn-helix transcriptional regulator [Ferroacidibacillus organovorans]KYP79981.1 transcriptional regulator [Ferroacidibacillus organovorans]OAG92914.1 XRE family transcriptional regulator [Ferroacidibacillus organovorans]